MSRNEAEETASVVVFLSQGATCLSEDCCFNELVL